GEHPPANASAIYVDVRPNLMEGLKKQDCRDCPTGKLDQPAPAPPVAVAPAPIHGLPFEIFIHIQRGMTEAEVLIRAGQPDLEVTEGTAENTAATASTANSVNPQTGAVTKNTNIIKNTITEIVKTYYYLPTISDPFTTTIRFRGGRVAQIQRIRKL
ncbi:MAG: hypothetical protein ACREVA_09050, partial [Burkholderiales bacterium]